MIKLRRTLALLLGTLLLVSAAPSAVLAAGGSQAALDAAAYRNRLIVVWRHAPERMSRAAVGVEGVGSAQRMAHAGWSVVTAQPGRSADVAAALRRDPRVRMVVPDVRVESAGWPLDGVPNDTRYGSQGDLPQIGVPEAWKTTTGTSSVIVAVLDTGVDLAHPDIAGVSVVAPRNEIANTTSVTDGDGHGTHVAGTIVARTNNARGIAGIAPGVRLMPVKVLDADGAGSFADILDGILWAADHGADVINLSLGSPLLTPQGVVDPGAVALAQAVVTEASTGGALVVAAAGNDGDEDNPTFYPASLAHVLSVGAVDGSGSVAPWSTHNAWVDISAPGVGIVSTTPGNTYATYSGTSMAAPHVTAVAALVRSAHPGLTPDEVEAVMRATATDQGDADHDEYYGDGVVNAATAVTGPVPDPMPELDVEPAPVGMAFSSPATLTVLPAGVTSQAMTLSISEELVDVTAYRERWRSVGGVCPGVFDAIYDERVITFGPTMTLSGIGDGYCGRIIVVADDLDGNTGFAFSPAVIGHDATAPRIASRTPAAGSTRASTTASIRIYLTEPVSGVSGRTVQLRNLNNGRLVSASVTYNTALKRITINPVNTLRRGTPYRVIVRSGIRDWAGNALASTYWRFRTAP